MGRSLRKRHSSIWLCFSCTGLAHAFVVVRDIGVNLSASRVHMLFAPKELWPSADLLVIISSYFLCSLAYIYKFL